MLMAWVIVCGMRFKKGDPYFPSNGSEGASFEERFCQRCTKRAECGILEVVMLGMDRPVQWVIAQDGPLPDGTCTAFDIDMDLINLERRLEDLCSTSPAIGAGKK